jgi:chemotaxis protein histidine kinase CheA
MPSWDATYQRLRDQYVRNAEGRLARVAYAIALLEAAPADKAALADLHREFHGLAGSGRIYGFDEVSALGRTGEREIAEALQQEATPTLDDLARWRGLLERVRSQFDAAEVE